MFIEALNLWRLGLWRIHVRRAKNHGTFFCYLEVIVKLLFINVKFIKEQNKTAEVGWVKEFASGILE